MRWCLALVLSSGCIWVSDAEHRDRLALLDGDGDGFASIQVGGEDCDDANPDIFPGAVERCATPYDDNCDGVVNMGPELVDGVQVFSDGDGDGFGDPESVSLACASEQMVDNGDDCDDTDALTYPGAPEACPGYGPDRDCSDEPRPCELSSDEFQPVLSQSGVGSALVASGELVTESVSGAVWLCPAQSFVDGRCDELAKRVELFDPGADQPEVVVARRQVAIGQPGVERDGAVQWIDASDGDLRVVQVGSSNRNSDEFGRSVAWFGAESTLGMASLDSLKGNKETLMFGLPQSTLADGDAVDAGAVRLVGQHWGIGDSLAVISEDEAQLYRWVPGEGMAPQGSVELTAVADRVVLADLDQDGQIDVLAIQDGELRAWRGPVGDRVGSADVWWRLAIDGTVSDLVVGQLTQDDLPDIAFSQVGAGGQVVLLRSGPGAPAGVDGLRWLTVKGVSAAQRFGASLAVTAAKVDGVDRGVLLIGAPGAGEVYAVTAPEGW